MKYSFSVQFFLVLLFSAYLDVGAFKPFSPSTPRNFDEKTPEKNSENKEIPKKFTLTTPLPRNLSPKERQITHFFSKKILSIAEALHNITASKEADTAREAKIKLRQQRAAQARRPYYGRGRQVSIPSSGRNSWGGSRWGNSGGFGGGYRPTGGYNWGGYNNPYRSNWGQPSYATSSPWGQSYPSSSGTYKSPSYDTDSWDDSSENSDKKKKKKKKIYRSSDSKKKKEKEERKQERKKQHEHLLDTTYQQTLAAMQKISKDLTGLSEEDRQAVYQNRLKMNELSSLATKFEKITELYQELPEGDRKEFEKKYASPEHTKVVTSFFPHLVRFLTVPTHNLASTDKDRCSAEQAHGAQVLLEHPFTSISTDARKSIIHHEQTILANHYTKIAQPDIDQLQAIAAKEPPALATDDQQKQQESFDRLKPLQEDLLDSQAKFQTYLDKPKSLTTLVNRLKEAIKTSESFYQKVKKQVQDRYTALIQKMNEDITNAQAALTDDEKIAFRKDYLEKTAQTRAKNYKDFYTCLIFLQDADQSEFEKQYQVLANKTMHHNFFPYLLDLLLYPADQTSIDVDIQSLCSAQTALNTWLLPIITQNLSDAEIQNVLTTKDNELANFYDLQAQPLETVLNDPIASVANKATAKDSLQTIADNIVVIINQKFDTTTVKPTKLQTLIDRIQPLL